MGYLEDLAAALAGEQAQAQIAAENPYYGFQRAPNAFLGESLNLMREHPTQYSNREKYGSALIGGLLSGMLGGVGDNYQATLTDRYNNALLGSMTGRPVVDEGLPSKLFKQATTQGSVFGLQRGLGLQDLREKSAMDMREEFSKALVGAKTARQQQQILQAGQRLGFIEAPKQAEATEVAPTATPTDSPERGVEGTLLDDVSREANKLMDEGAEPPQAFATAREMLKTKREELDRQYKRVEEAETKGQELKTVTGQLRSALAGAGDTGLAGGLRNIGSQVLGLISEGQRSKAAAGQDVQTFAGEAIKNMGPAFKGPMSDRDVQIMLKTAPSLNTDEETNQKILDRWDFAAELQQTYAEFMRAAQAKGVPVSEAESAWNQLRKDNPYVIRKGNSWEINPAWLGGGNPMTGKSSGGATGSWGDHDVPEVGTTFKGEKVKSVRKVR